MTGPRNAVRRLAIPSIAVVCAASLLAAVGGPAAALSASRKPAVSTRLAVGAKLDTASKSTTTTTPKASGGGTPSSGGGAVPVDVGNPHASSSANVTFTPKTVVISPSQVSSSLSSVSADGSTYTFSKSSGPLGELAPGKVMLLEGFDAANVTGVQHVGELPRRVYGPRRALRHCPVGEHPRRFPPGLQRSLRYPIQATLLPRPLGRPRSAGERSRQPRPCPTALVWSPQRAQKR